MPEPTILKQNEMTFVQEMCNAISIAAPSLVLMFCWIHKPETDRYTTFTHIFIISAWTHMPISLSYHMMCSLGCFKDRVNCPMRKLDQSFIHACCATYSYALSGNLLYGMGSFVLNTWYIIKLWMPGPHDVPFERRTNVFLMTMFYLFPLLTRGDFSNYFGALGSFILAAFFFHTNSKFFGWGHSISHLCCCPFLYFLLMSSVKMNPNISSCNVTW